MNTTSVIFSLIAIVFMLASYTIVHTVLAEPLVCPECKVAIKLNNSLDQDKLSSAVVAGGHNVIACQHDSGAPDASKDLGLCTVYHP